MACKHDDRLHMMRISHGVKLGHLLLLIVTFFIFEIQLRSVIFRNDFMSDIGKSTILGTF